MLANGFIGSELATNQLLELSLLVGSLQVVVAAEELLLDEDGWDRAVAEFGANVGLHVGTYCAAQRENSVGSEKYEVSLDRDDVSGRKPAYRCAMKVSKSEGKELYM